MKFAIAAGHQETLSAAKEILLSGGNAVDAAIAAFLTATVSEPCMIGLGGGSLALIMQPDGKCRFFDFFCQTPKRKIKKDLEDFYVNTVDFGNTKEDFYIGAGSMATPGGAAGIFALHDVYGTIPIKELFQYAIKIGKEGVVLDDFQAYDIELLQGILGQEEKGRELYFQDGIAKVEGDVIYNHEYADFLDILSVEGKRLFYEGEVAELITDICKERGGHLTKEDLGSFHVFQREVHPLYWHNHNLYLPQFPSIGGPILYCMLKEMEYVREEVLSKPHFLRLANTTRKVAGLASNPKRLAEYMAEEYGLKVFTHASLKAGGTTHFSIIDKDGLGIAITSSLGEGCGIFVPGTGFQMNNMLGEAALLPEGFYSWKEDERLMSMMTPVIVKGEHGDLFLAGSGGAGRIPFVLAQQIMYTFSHQKSLLLATDYPRMFFHNNMVEVEPGFDLPHYYPFRINEWDANSLYFGGVHTVMQRGGTYSASGDPRRSGKSFVYR